MACSQHGWLQAPAMAVIDWGKDQCTCLLQTGICQLQHVSRAPNLSIGGFVSWCDETNYVQKHFKFKTKLEDSIRNGSLPMSWKSDKVERAVIWMNVGHGACDKVQAFLRLVVIVLYCSEIRTAVFDKQRQIQISPWDLGEICIFERFSGNSS